MKSSLRIIVASGMIVCAAVAAVKEAVAMSQNTDDSLLTSFFVLNNNSPEHTKSEDPFTSASNSNDAEEVFFDALDEDPANIDEWTESHWERWDANEKASWTPEDWVSVEQNGLYLITTEHEPYLKDDNIMLRDVSHVYKTEQHSGTSQNRLFSDETKQRVVTVGKKLLKIPLDVSAVFVLSPLAVLMVGDMTGLSPTVVDLTIKGVLYPLVQESTDIALCNVYHWGRVFKNWVLAL